MSLSGQSIFRASRLHFAGVIFACFALAGCDRMITPKGTQIIKDADASTTAGDYAKAIALYETALDGTAKSADVHYRLGVLYDDKMNDPLNAVHHFRRYLALAPNGPRAADAKKFMKRDELSLVTSLSGDGVMSRTEAARLKNENLTLHKELEERRAQIANATATGAAKDAKAKKGAADAKASAHGGRTYVVRRGDTLASISRKFYKKTAGWKRILDANRKIVDDPENLKVGETLTIP